MLKELKAKRSAKIQEQKDLVDAVAKETRALKPEEKEKLTALRSEVDALTETITAAEGVEQAHTADNAATRALGRQDTAEQVAGDMAEKDLARYSILRAIRARAENRPLDGLEAEVSQEIAKRSGKNPQGFYVPTRVLATRALDTTAGVGAIKQAVSSTYIDLLRAQTVIAKLGAVFMGGLVGKFGIPRQSAGANTYWLAEGGSPTAGAPALDQVTLAPKTVGAYTDITRAFMSQSSVDAEQFVRNDLTLNLAIAIDKAAVNGSGSSGQPTGILNTAGISTVAVGTNGGTPTFANIVTMETNVANANVQLTNPAYLTTPKARGLLKTTAKIGSTYPTFIWGDNNEVNGYGAYASNIVPSNLTKGTGTNLSAAIFGNWSDLIVGTWGALDLLVDPYTLSSSGGIRVVALQDTDIELRQAASFAVMVDIAA